MTAGWQTARLGDVATVSTGPFGSLLHKSDYVDHGVPLVNPTNIVGDLIVADPAKLISTSTQKRLVSYVLREGDVVVGRRGEIGRCAVVGAEEDGWICGTGSFHVRPSAELDSRFLAHLIRSPLYRGRLEALSTGATMKSLSNTGFADLAIAVPSLNEQLRIVAILDEAFAAIATARANAEKNLENARAVFDSYLESVFVGRGLGWQDRLLGECATFRNGINFTKSSRGETVQIVGVKDFQSRFWAPLDDLDTVVTDARLPDSDLLRENDILFVRSNGNLQLIGRCLLVGTVIGRIAHSGFTIRARLSDGSMDPRFLCHFLKSGYARRTMVASGTGTNIKSLNQATLAALVVPTPPLLEQAVIVGRIQALEDEATGLASIYQRKLAALGELKKSLLHQAFTGQL